MDDHAEDSVLMFKGLCDECGSSDANAVYTDGHTYCFSCDTYGKADDAEGATPESRPAPRPKAGLLRTGEFRSLGKRRLTEETCRKFGYSVSEDWRGNTVQIAAFKKDNTVIAQKVRYPNKGFLHLGDQKPGLWGQHLWKPGGKMLVITEGEIDCMTVSQLQGNKWPVVSLPNGSDKNGKSAVRAIQTSFDFVSSFDKVIFMFDMDEAGRAASIECAKIMKPGQGFIADLPLKDPNELHVLGRGKEVVEAMWNAKPYRPDGMVLFSEIKQGIKKPIEWGIPWFSDSLTQLTYGRRYGEIYCLGAGTGIGKTDWFTQQVIYDAVTLNEKVGLFFMEQQPEETGKRIAGKLAGRRFHIPRLKDHPNFDRIAPKGYKEEWTDEELCSAVDTIGDVKNIFMFDSFGATEWGRIREMIRFQAHSEGIRIFYLDHLTALAAAEEDERKGLERITSEMGSLVKELNIMIIMISHLATPEGKPHEEGGRVMIRHFKGSRSIGYWCHYMFGLERDQQHENPEWRKTTTFRILKDRYTGNSTGEVIYFGYGKDDGQLFEREEPSDDDADGSSHGFTDRSDDY